MSNYLSLFTDLTILHNLKEKKKKRNINIDLGKIGGL